MKIKFADSFFDSFERMVNRQRWYWKTVDLFRYDLPNFFRNLWLFRKNLWNHTWYNGDSSILPWVKTVVDDMAWKIETRGHEVDESRMKKVEKMKRLSYLIDVCVHDTFIEEAEKELGIEFEYDFMAPQKGDVVVTYSDTTEIEKLGYKASTSLEQGIPKFVAWFLKYYGPNEKN